MSAHQAFPEPAKVGGAAVREFRHDHHIPALWIEAEQIGAALQMAVGGAAGSRVLDQSHVCWISRMTSQAAETFSLLAQ